VALTFDIEGAASAGGFFAGSAAANSANSAFPSRCIPPHTHTSAPCEPKRREPFPSPRSHGAPQPSPEKPTLGTRRFFVRCYVAQCAHGGDCRPVIRHPYLCRGREERERERRRERQEGDLAGRSTTSHRNTRQGRASCQPPNFPNTGISKRSTFGACFFFIRIPSSFSLPEMRAYHVSLTWNCVSSRREPSYLAPHASRTRPCSNAGRKGSRTAWECPHRGTPTGCPDLCPRRRRRRRARSCSRMA
jgi:hypothetical protein